jgi:hypothetical protein
MLMKENAIPMRCHNRGRLRYTSRKGGRKGQPTKLRLPDFTQPSIAAQVTRSVPGATRCC